MMNRSTFEVALAVEAQASLLAPRDTGLLAGSITAQSRDEGSRPRAPAGAADIIQKPYSDMMAFVGTPVFYGPYMEFGTVKTDAQSFLRPAADLVSGKALTLVEREGKIVFKDYLS
jgi:hypothetical protein